MQDLDFFTDPSFAIDFEMADEIRERVDELREMLCPEALPWHQDKACCKRLGLSPEVAK